MLILMVGKLREHQETCQIIMNVVCKAIYSYEF